jgi:hypothetical protein
VADLLPVSAARFYEAYEMQLVECGRGEEVIGFIDAADADDCLWWLSSHPVR